jgi:hypothetical protein
MANFAEPRRFIPKFALIVPELPAHVVKRRRAAREASR